MAVEDHRARLFGQHNNSSIPRTGKTKQGGMVSHFSILTQQKRKSVESDKVEVYVRWKNRC
jgi:hypothetical protein